MLTFFYSSVPAAKFSKINKRTGTLITDHRVGNTPVHFTRLHSKYTAKEYNAVGQTSLITMT